MRWFFAFLFFVSVNTFSALLEYPVKKHDIGPHTEFRVNGITDFKLPVDILPDSKIVLADGLVMIIKGVGEISIETITSTSIGYKNTDMRLWPLYIMGYQKVIDDSSFSLEMKKANNIFKSSYQPYKQGVFTTKTGKGFIALGREGSVIYLIDNDVSEFITSINIRNMTEEDINNLIIQGLI